ncbi:MAG: sel1 repeat family protein [Rhizobiaceae bacterium]|nr:sel1 repeat family protein [Rhizobiaceae bacterium]
MRHLGIILPGVCVAGAALAQSQPELGDPWAAFKFGYNAYQQGNKAEAVEAYRYAAENGLPGARWKLAQMYASGDGVPRDDLAAFRMFEDVIRTGAEPGSQDESYVADAYVSLARYLRDGIPGTEIAPNAPLARDLYMRAATFYGSPEAQFELGRMILSEEPTPNGFMQAARWLQLAVKKGHFGAQALLGKIYFESGRTVRGLAMLTDALKRADQANRAWILSLQEKAFALTSEADRRTAMALAEGDGTFVPDNGQGQGALPVGSGN